MLLIETVLNQDFRIGGNF